MDVVPGQYARVLRNGTGGHKPGAGDARLEPGDVILVREMTASYVVYSCVGHRCCLDLRSFADSQVIRPSDLEGLGTSLSELEGLEDPFFRFLLGV